MIAGVAAVATRSMRLVAFTELFTSLHRMLSPSCWFVALLLSGGICHPKEMKAGSWSFLDIHIISFTFIYCLCSLWDFGCFLLWGFLLSADPWVIKFMERNHLGLAMVLGHGTSSNCIFNYIYNCFLFAISCIYRWFSIFVSITVFFYFLYFNILWFLLYFNWAFGFCVVFYCFFFWRFLFWFPKIHFLLCYSWVERPSFARSMDSDMDAAPIPEGWETIRNWKSDIHADGHRYLWCSRLLPGIKKCLPVWVSTQWLSFHDPNNLMLFHMAWVGFCLLEVSSCIRDMQVLSLGSHQNAGRKPWWGKLM